jgi:hypothetical protein
MFRFLLSTVFVGLAYLSAQVLPVGTVDGTTSDSSGARLPGIKVSLKNLETGVTSEMLTNDSGYYFFPLVNPGRYEVSVEKAGFGARRRRSLCAPPSGPRPTSRGRSGNSANRCK